MTATKVSVLQKAPGTVEVIVGQNSILVNCAILMKLLSTKPDFTVYNAMQEECSISVRDSVCTFKMGNQVGQAYRGEFLRAIAPFEVVMADKDKIFVELNNGVDLTPAGTATVLVGKPKEEWEGSLHNEY